MQYKRFDLLDTDVSALCLGTQEFSQNEQWWGIDHASAYRRIVDTAIDAGINFIDTAEAYGECEQILGEILEGKRDKIVLASKILADQWDYETVRQKLESSLQRLRTDYLDLYIIHWPKDEMQPQDYDDIHRSLERLKKEGMIRAAGLSNFRLRHLRNFDDEAFSVITTDQVPLNLLWREYDQSELLEFCRARGIKLTSYASLAQGLLTGGYTGTSGRTVFQRANVLFNEPVYSRALEVVAKVKKVAGELDATPAQVALKWVMDRSDVVSSLVGVRNTDELEENLKAANLELTEEQTVALDRASREFWGPMPPELRMWIPDNAPNDGVLDRIGLEWKEWSHFQGSV